MKTLDARLPLAIHQVGMNLCHLICLEVLSREVGKEWTLYEIRDATGYSLTNLTNHLARLAQCGLVDDTRTARSGRCELNRYRLSSDGGAYLRNPTNNSTP